MKLAVSNIGWNEENNIKVLSYLKEKKYSAIEIAPTKIIPENPYDNSEIAKNFKKEIEEKYNLSVCSMQSIWYGQSGNIFNLHEQRKLKEYTYKAIDFASEIECPNLVFGNPKARNKDNPNLSDIIALDFFRDICNYALKKNVTIAVEPNPTIYGTNFLNTTLEAIEFVKKVNLPSCKVNIDFGTIVENNDNLKDIYDNYNLIGHIHISEPNLIKVENRNIHTEFLKEIKKLGYDKYISIEMKATDNIEDLFDVIDYLRGIADGI